MSDENNIEEMVSSIIDRSKIFRKKCQDFFLCSEPCNPGLSNPCTNDKIIGQVNTLSLPCCLHNGKFITDKFGSFDSLEGLLVKYALTLCLQSGDPSMRSYARLAIDELSILEDCHTPSTYCDLLKCLGETTVDEINDTLFADYSLNMVKSLAIMFKSAILVSSYTVNS